jgi:putative Ca2+/H+ antiporter (TMEM165/GDT1 family)
MFVLGISVIILLIESQQKHFCFSIQSFILTFLAEWGDRSQIATIAVSSFSDSCFLIEIIVAWLSYSCSFCLVTFYLLFSSCADWSFEYLVSLSYFVN